MTSTDVAAIVLAAGRSERMGDFKPLLPFGSQTVIESCIQSLTDGGVQNVVVVVGEGRRAEALKSHLRSIGVSIAVNPDSNSEMNASIAAGIAELSDAVNAVLLTPADHPAVPAEVVAMLIQEWRNGALLAKPTWEGRGGHPLLVDLSFREDLLNLDPSGGLKAFLRTHEDQLRRVAVSSNYVARDMDTWDDYVDLHQDVFGVTPPPREILESERG